MSAGISCCRRARRCGARRRRAGREVSAMYMDMQGEVLDRLHAVIHAHPQWQWEIDERCRFTKVAEGLLELMGRERESVLGEPVNAFMTAAEAARVRRFFASRPK